MFNWFNKFYFKLQIAFLVFFKPSVLFDRINQLDWYKNTLRLWVDELGTTANNKVLEVGCASGALTTYIDSLGCIPTGVDYSSDMIALAKSKNSDIEFLEADVTDLPFETNIFDVVIAASLINIVEDKAKAIRELLRTCKQGGVVSVLVPITSFTNTNFDDLQKTLGSTGFSAAAMRAWHSKAPKMDESEIIGLFEQAGLSDVTTKSYLHGMVVSISAIKPL